MAGFDFTNLEEKFEEFKNDVFKVLSILFELSLSYLTTKTLKCNYEMVRNQKKEKCCH